MFQFFHITGVLLAATLLFGAQSAQDLTANFRARFARESDPLRKARLMPQYGDLQFQEIQAALDEGNIAQAVVDLVGLDTGRVLLLQNGTWQLNVLQTRSRRDVESTRPPSQQVLSKVRHEKRTFWQAPSTHGAASSGVPMPEKRVPPRMGFLLVTGCVSNPTLRRERG